MFAYAVQIGQLMKTPLVAPRYHFAGSQVSPTPLPVAALTSARSASQSCARSPCPIRVLCLPVRIPASLRVPASPLAVPGLSLISPVLLALVQGVYLSLTPYRNGDYTAAHNNEPQPCTRFYGLGVCGNKKKIKSLQVRPASWPPYDTASCCAASVTQRVVTDRY
jgi:hypothetical protein